MELKDFIHHFAELFDETEKAIFSAGTDFKGLDEYSSLIALSIIAMIDEEYDVMLNGDDIRNSNTIEDLYKVVQSKM